MWYKCGHKRRSSIEAQREAKQWMVAKLNKEEYIGCMLSIKGYNCDQYLLSALTMALCCCLTFDMKAVLAGNPKLSRSKPITCSLKED